MANDNVVLGAAKKVEGSAESVFGTVTGNRSTELKGDARRVLGAAQSAFGKAEDYVSETFSSTREEINHRPVRSALIALGIGFVLGRLLSL